MARVPRGRGGVAYTANPRSGELACHLGAGRAFPLVATGLGSMAGQDSELGQQGYGWLVGFCYCDCELGAE